MHVNPFRPNILQDMLSSRDLRSRNRYGAVCAKRHIVPKRIYPYSNTRQDERQQRLASRLMARQRVIAGFGGLPPSKGTIRHAMRLSGY